jgi:hypothetical protein
LCNMIDQFRFIHSNPRECFWAIVMALYSAG